MKRKGISLFLCVSLVLSMTGCAGQKETPAAGETSRPAEVRSAGTEGEQGKENGKKQGEEATETGELTIYHSNPSDWCDPIIEEFQDQTGIQVNIVTGSTGDLASKIKAESGNTQADILWGGSPVTYNGIAELLWPYDSPMHEAQYEFCVDRNHLWHGFDMAPHVILYNTNLVSEAEAPKGWGDLTDPKWKGQISQADPTSSSTALCISMIMLQAFGGEDGGYDYIRSFYGNLDGKINSSSSNVYKAVAEGEYAIGVTYEYPVLDLMSSGADVQIVYPEEGTYNSPSAIAIIKDGPNQKNAEAFIDYVLGKEVQGQLSSLLKRSTRKDITDIGDMTPVSEIKAMNYDEQWVAEHTKEFKDFWKDLEE